MNKGAQATLNVRKDDLTVLSKNQVARRILLLMHFLSRFNYYVHQSSLPSWLGISQPTIYRMFDHRRPDSLVKRNLVEAATLINTEKRKGLPYKLSEKGEQIARTIISTLELEDRWRKWQEEFERTKDIKIILKKLNFL